MASIVRKYSFVLIILIFLVLHQAIIRTTTHSSDPDGNIIIHPATAASLGKSTIKSKRILIVSTWRSGSSFLGELIGSSPGVFYSFEPMTKHIPSIFRCQFPNDYMEFIKGKTHLQINWRVWDECQHFKRPELCQRPQFLSQLCASYPVNLIKAVELPVKDLVSLMTSNNNSSSSSSSSAPLIDEDADGDLKIIYLVRDPRGTLSSRAKLKWCQANPNCREPDRLCSRIEADLDMLEKHSDGQNNRHHLLLKFEDLAVNVRTETEKLFQFLELPVTELTRAFLDTHTKSNQTTDNPFSTFRQSEAVAYGWKTKLTQEKIDAITDVCSPLLKKLGIIT